MSKKGSSSAIDLISNLPDYLIEQILLKLPFRDAARTCILSTRWRHSWVNLPEISLDSHFWKQSMQEGEGNVKFALILSRILLLHQGSITYFELDIPQHKSSPEIDSSLSFVFRNGLEEFLLQMGVDEGYTLPSSVFTCTTLTTLCLFGCKINFILSSFTGFSLLTTLYLYNVDISAEALQTLVSSCPLLETLQLKTTIDIQYIDFNAPNLDTFLYYDLSSSYTQSSLHQLNNLPKQAICKLFDGLPCISTLFLDGACLESLGASGVPMILPSLLLHLVSIELYNVRLQEKGEFSCVSCLINSSPNLQKFKIVTDGYKSMTENLQGPEDDSHLTYNHLVEVTVERVVGGRAEMQLIKLLLAKSPALRKMSIKLVSHKAEENIKIMKELFLFKHASSNVTIHIID